MSQTQDIFERANHCCELCGGSDELTTFTVDGQRPPQERALLVCGVCGPQLQGEAALDPMHLRCLQSSIWSTVPAVQVASFRLLHRLKAEGWAAEQLEQAYLEDDVLAWAQEGVESDDEGELEPGAKTLDANGNELVEGDSVTLVRNLDVKGASFVAKQGTLVKNIRLTDDPRYVEGKVNGTVIVLKTMYLKRA